MPRASQRHKHETDPSVWYSQLSALEVQFFGVAYPDTVITVHLNGDSTGPESVTHIPDATQGPQGVATEFVALINALTGYTSSASGGVLTIAADAPNTTVEITGVDIYPPQ